MICQVCYQNFTGNACPRCGFPVVESPNANALAESMQSQVAQYRRNFLQTVRLELIIYRWKDAGDRIVLDREERLPFEAFPKLIGAVTWLPQVFARIPDVPALDLKLRVATERKTQEMTVSVPNLDDPSLQQIGIEADDRLRFRLILKNSTGAMRTSQWYEIP